ncbi:hypothetical protein [Urbifossiella limnaea]|uniref:Uncharacterized protein n=1 Tax=Urbifossiella limnaea TaxID=2528023 RepID=A0A517XWN9_9BACT|nr:hypothetical protein [Urbifossiella limnaea]QDU21884.1 hypothetical protein ETAA1_38570 [Urbifossiella limnaea]
MAHRGRDADDRLALELAAGATVRDAAGATGVGERTAHRRLADPAFKARVVAARGEMFAAAAGRLAAGLGGAADTLLGLVAHPDPGVRLRAAAKVLELGTELGVVADLHRQVDELEREAASRAGR